MMRKDLSKTLIHFVKGKDDTEALESLWNIINDACIVASPAHNESVVCFTELPLEIIKENGFRNEKGMEVYKKFGLLFDLKLLYDIGARPVCYLDKDEIKILQSELKWKFSPFNPSFDDRYKKGDIDFRWEREWRLNKDFNFHDLGIEPTLIVRNKDFSLKLKKYIETKLEDCECEFPNYVYEEVYEDSKYKIVEKGNDDFFIECSTYILNNGLKIITLDD
jgi:hypothetical protein